MAKRPLPAHVESAEALRTTADLILGRASAIAVPPAKDRALELARIVLGEAPNFGAREMRDEEIIEALKAEQIGPATFKKALSTVRKELAKRPPASSPRRTKPPAEKLAATSSQGPANTPPQATGSPMAVNLDRSLL